MSVSEKPIRVLVAGLGNMGRSHVLAYHNNPGFEIVGLVNRSMRELPEELGGYRDGVEGAEAGPLLHQHLFRQPC